MLESIVSFSSIYWFSYFYESVCNFFKFFQCRLFIENSRKSTENGFEQWDITETKWIRLLIFSTCFLTTN